MIRDLPDNRFRAAGWKPPFRFARNRSEWTGSRQQVWQPGALWTCQLEHIPIIGQPAIEPWRALQAQLAGDDTRFRVSAVEQPQHAMGNPFALAAPNGSLIVTANMTIDGTLTVAEKTGGGAAWNAGFLSTDPLPVPSVATFTPLTTAHAVMAGLRSGANGGAGFAELSRAFYWESASTYRIYEDGAPVTASAPRVAGDRFAIVHLPGQVLFLKNSGTVHTSTAPGGAQYYLDSSFNDVGGKIGEIGFAAAVGGATTAYLGSIAPGSTLLPAGALMTVRLLNGDEQLVMLTDALTADGNGVARVEFAPPLRDYPFPDAIIETREPWCVMELDDPALGWGAGIGQIYDLGGIAVSEAF